ncbi:nucleotidyltransferase domain-containing protein [Gloeobacter morelensis MG652769]|uniref:Nucleotidyltransferase domain-containing protein n=2 Tax=Gloeobacter TaxID=33071 RepID=A0ABY3PUH2_9CYAN|nr:nucleotidyltransferase domain-containing protein [Gloeobacter morelensis MG652769]
MLHLVLFGSYARQEAGPESDIDVLIVLEGSFDYAEEIERTSALIARLSLESNRVISRSFCSAEYFARAVTPFLRNVRREGRVI